MDLSKNSFKCVSFLVIAILVTSFTFITVQDSLSVIDKLNSAVLTGDFPSDKENSDSEEDVNEDSSNLFFSGIPNLKFQTSSKKTQKKQSVFLIPRVFFDVHILPPEAQVS